jgi:hypothetical protein
MNKRQKNKISTPGYFIKRLRDCGFSVIRIFQKYGAHDPRRWTVLIDPGRSSIFVTCFTNKTFIDEIYFELNDGGILFPKNFAISTQSIEVIVSHLNEKNIQTIDEKSPYYVEKNK